MTPTSFWRVFFTGKEGKFLATIIALGFLYSISWSGFFIYPVAMTTTKEQIIFVRKTPFGTVNGDWVVEATSADGMECLATGEAIYQYKENNTVKLAIPAPLLPCLARTAVIDMSIKVRILGIQLRPVRMITISEGVNDGH